MDKIIIALMRKVCSLDDQIKQTTPSHKIPSIHFVVVSIHDLMSREKEFLMRMAQRLAILQVSSGDKNQPTVEILQEMQSNGYMIKGHSQQISKTLEKFKGMEFRKSVESEILMTFEGFTSNESNFLTGMANRIAELL